MPYAVAAVAAIVAFIVSVKITGNWHYKALWSNPTITGFILCDIILLPSDATILSV